MIEENNLKHIIDHPETLGKAVLVAELIEKKIKKLGNRTYIIEGTCRKYVGLLTSVVQYEELLHHLSKNIEIKGFIYLQPENVSHPEDDKTKELDNLLSRVDKEKLLKKIVCAKDPKQIENQFLELLKKDGLQIPPSIPIICILGGPGSGKGTNC